MDAKQDLLTRKFAALGIMRSSYRSDYLQSTAHSRPFIVDTPQPLPAYPVPGAPAVVIATYRVPPGMNAVLNKLAIVHIGAAGSFVDGSGNALWHVLINGATLRGLENIYVQVGTLAVPSDAAIPLTQNDTITITVEVPAAKVAPVGNPAARLGGFLDVGGQGGFVPRGSYATAAAAAAAGAVPGAGGGFGGGVPGGGGTPGGGSGTPGGGNGGGANQGAQTPGNS